MTFAYGLVTSRPLCTVGSRCSWFWPLVISDFDNHNFNLIWMCSVNCSEIMRLVIHPPESPAVVQITVSAVKVHISVCEVNWFHAIWD